jgi:hypothetical protein
MIFLGFLIMLFGKLVDEAGCPAGGGLSRANRRFVIAGWTLKADDLS